MDSLTLFADGSARGNPGPAGIGVVVVDAEGNILRRFGEQLPPCTNNEAEYHALIRGLQVCQQLGAYSVTVRMDSELVLLQVLGHYRVHHTCSHCVSKHGSCWGGSSSGHCNGLKASAISRIPTRRLPARRTGNDRTL